MNSFKKSSKAVVLDERYEREKTSDLSEKESAPLVKGKQINSGVGWKLLRKNLKEKKLRTQSNCLIIDEVKNKENSLGIPQNFGVS